MAPTPADLRACGATLRPFLALRNAQADVPSALQKGAIVHKAPERRLCASQKLLAARRQSHCHASTSYSEAEELRLDASEYYRQLASVARIGDAEEARDILTDMNSAGLEITPQAYHSLIFSYMRAGDSDGALNALDVALESSVVKLLPESYAVVICVCAENGEFQAAETIYNLVQSGVDRYPSWLAYLKGLVGAGLKESDQELQIGIMEKVEQILQEGEHQGWHPDPDLFEEVLGLLCEDPKKAVVAEDMLFEVLERREGGETRHYNCILRAQAIWMGVHNARILLDDMIEGKTGGKNRVLPNIHSYNALLEGCVAERMQGAAYAFEDLEGVVAETLTVGIQMNKRSHTLLLMFYVLDANLDRMLFELREMERLSAEGRVLEHLTDAWLSEVVDFLLSQKCVLEVARLLFILHEEGRPLPPKLSLLDEYGHSFHTNWLPAFLSGQHFERRNEGLEKYHESDSEEDEEPQDAILIDDTYLNKDNVAINENTGQEMSVSDMNAAQMKAELEAKGLSTKGLKGDLSRRVQHSRGNQPIPVREVIRRRQAEVDAKLSRDDEKQSELEVLKSVRSVARFNAEWNNMGEPCNTIEYDTYVVDPVKEQREKDREHLADLEAMDIPEETKWLLKERRIAFNVKDVETEYQLDTLIFNPDTPEFQAQNPNFNGREGYGIRMMWPKFGKGARLALYMLDLTEQMGGQPTIVDYVEIQEACMEETDPDTAFALLSKVHENLETIDEDMRALFYNKTLLLCIQTERLDLAAVVAEMMIDVGLEPTDILGDEKLLPVLQEYGSTLADILKDIRAEGEAEIEEVEAKIEEAEAEGLVSEDTAAQVGDDVTQDASEGADESWEEGLGEGDVLLRDEEEVATEDADDEVEGFDYEVDEDTLDVLVTEEEVVDLVEMGALEEIDETGALIGDGGDSDKEELVTGANSEESEGDTAPSEPEQNAE